MFRIVAFLSVITGVHIASECCSVRVTIRHFQIARETKSVLPRNWIGGCFGDMEIPAFEWTRISRKWNISAAREQWGLGQFKCSMGRMECYKRDALYHVGSILGGTLFSPCSFLFIYFLYIFNLLNDRSSFAFEFIVLCWKYVWTVQPS